MAAWRSHSLRQIEHLPQSTEMVGCTMPIRLLVTLHMIFTFWVMMVSVNGISNNMVMSYLLSQAIGDTKSLYGSGLQESS